MFEDVGQLSNWNLTVSEVLQHSLFIQAEVVAGEKGLSRSVRWVHILESAENAVALNGHELILATGIDLGDNPDKLLTYLEKIMEREASGLCLRLGHYVSEIPAEAIARANQAAFPIIVFRNPVRFVDITLDLHQTIVNRHVQVLATLDEYARSLQKLSLEGQHVSRIVNYLQEATRTEVYYIARDGSSIAAPVNHTKDQTEIAQRLKKLLFSSDEVAKTRGVLEIENNRSIIYQPVIAMGQVLAFLVVPNIQGQDEFFGLLLDYTATTTAQILLRGMIIQERALDNEGKILQDILDGKLNGEEEIKKALAVAENAVTFYLALIIESGDTQSEFEEEGTAVHRTIYAMFRSIASNFGFRTIFLADENKLYLLLLAKNQAANWRDQTAKTIEKFKSVGERTFGKDVFSKMGISRPADHYTAIKASFEEARRALECLPFTNSPYYNDLGILRLLTELKNTRVLETCIEDYLGPILKYDQEHSAELYPTLRTFLNHNLSKQETADKLFIHRQTLYHRLEKIEELIGSCYYIPEQRLCLEMACQIHEWLRLQSPAQ